MSEPFDVPSGWDNWTAEWCIIACYAHWFETILNMLLHHGHVTCDYRSARRVQGQGDYNRIKLEPIDSNRIKLATTRSNIFSHLYQPEPELTCRNRWRHLWAMLSTWRWMSECSRMIRRRREVVSEWRRSAALLHTPIEYNLPQLPRNRTVDLIPVLFFNEFYFTTRL